MDGFDQQIEIEKQPVPWKPIAIVVGAVVVAIVIVVVIVTIVRSGEKKDAVEEQANQVIDQIERSFIACDGLEDPSDCREAKIKAAATKLGNVEICGELESSAFDSCVLGVARGQNEPDLCRSIQNKELSESCWNIGNQNLALKTLDSSYCKKIRDSEMQSRCEDTLNPVTTGNCSERGLDADYCEMLSVSSQASQAQDPDLCEQLANSDYVNICKEGVLVIDRDFDGLDNGIEDIYGSSDYSADTDGDGLGDYEEVEVYKSDPILTDTDGDGFNDGSEVENGYNPTGSGMI